MIRLIEVEVRRFLARRLFHLFLVVAVGGALIGGTITFLNSSPAPAADPAAIEAGAHAVYAACLQETGAQVGPDDQQDLEEYCRIVADAQVRHAVADPGFRLTALPGILAVTTVPLVLLAWILAASFIGAEWGSGNMVTHLTWEPRRGRVLASKAVAAAIVTAITTIIIQEVITLALLPAAVFRGTTEGFDTALAMELVDVVLRGAGLAGLVAFLGFALGALGRSTAAALGVGFGYLVVFEGLVSGLRPRLSRWLITDNAIAFMTGESLRSAGRTATEAGLLLGGYAVALLIVATVALANRDVT